MRCLVTGGAGFIGSHLVEALGKRGDEVTILDDLSAGRVANLFLSSKCRLVKGSICNLDLLHYLAAKTDIVFHLAAQCLVKCNEDPEFCHGVNDRGTLNVCLAAKESHTKIVYVSTSEVYGTAQYVPMDEKHPTNPYSIYGITKLAGEKYVQGFNKLYSVPAVIIRAFNAYGPRHREDQYSAVITSFFKRLAQNKPPIIYGTGEQSRDFTYVTDIVDGIILLSKLSDGEIVNIGYGEDVTIKDLCLMVDKIWGFNQSCPFIHDDPRPNDVFKLEADISCARRLGYEPKVSLAEGLKLYVQWYREKNLLH